MGLRPKLLQGGYMGFRVEGLSSLKGGYMGLRV